MGDKLLCIHGHFYQPPREEPWMEQVQPEGTAAPAANWNERIVSESYAPLAWARRLDGQGRVIELVNCYEWMNFNVGPTLLSWLENHAPDVYARILEADRRSADRLGHGNAMAQVYHHAIMPLMSEMDKELEVAWAVQDFEHRYGRAPEGMWLAEAAVDTPTLEVLAEYGIAFTILAPSQAAAVDMGDGWRDVAEHEVDISHPWQVELPSGQTMSVFFYNGPLSRAVAFEGVLDDGERFWNRLTQAHYGGLTSIGTDGETYGHHHRYGEMALAYVLEQARSGRDGFGLTNYAAYLADHPPVGRVWLHENSSWSCVHGIERWRSDCGCTDGGHPGWQQQWRTPLREGLDALKKELDAHFFNAGKGLFKESHKALTLFGMLVCGSSDVESFKRIAFKSRLSREKVEKGFRLLRMQKWALSMYASCAWFFDDLARVEPRGAMACALRAMELAGATGAEMLQPVFREYMVRAKVNDERFETGADVFDSEVLPRSESDGSLIAQAVLTLVAGEGLAVDVVARVNWPGVSVELFADSETSGTAEVFMLPGGVGRKYAWTWQGRDSVDLFAGRVDIFRGDDRVESIEPGRLFWKNRQMIALHQLGTHEEDRWEEMTDKGMELMPLFLEYRAYQNGPMHAAEWMSWWRELAAAFVVADFDGPGREKLVHFLAMGSADHPAVPWLNARLGMVLASLVACAIGPESIAQFLERARAVGLEPVLWQAQNLAWEQAASGQGKELLPVLGFADLPQS